jgi:hypothetical protein
MRSRGGKRRGSVSHSRSSLEETEMINSTGQGRGMTRKKGADCEGEEEGAKTYLNRPNPQPSDPTEPIEPRRRILRDEVVLLSERTGHVAGAVTGFHLWEGESVSVLSPVVGRAAGK